MEAAEILESANVNQEAIRVLHPGVNFNMMAKLLQSRSEFRQFDKAEVILQGLELLNSNTEHVDGIAYVYCEVSNYYFWRSMYKESFTWSLKAVEGIRTKTPARVMVDILRQAGKQCKRHFQKKISSLKSTKNRQNLLTFLLSILLLLDLTSI